MVPRRESAWSASAATPQPTGTYTQACTVNSSVNSSDEDRLEAAKRELREETGITADEWTDMGEFIPAAAYCDEKLTLYLARGLHYGPRDLDDDEFLNVETVPFGELVDDVMNGRIVDAKTQTAVLKAACLTG